MGVLPQLPSVPPRRDYIWRTGRGIGFIAAGTVVWSVFALLGLVLPEPLRPFIYLFGAGVQFPAGILASTLLKHDWQAQGNPFGLFTGLVGGLPLLFAPIVIGVLPYLTYVVTPFAVAAVLLAGTLLLHRENQKDAARTGRTAIE